MKINNELEKIGDEAVNITEKAEYLVSKPLPKPLIDIPKMADADDRKQVIAWMCRVLDEFMVEGIKTTIPFHLKVLENPDFQSGGYSTKFTEEKLIKEPHDTK